MQKAISIIVFGAVLLTLFLCSCSDVSDDEETTDISDEIIEAIDRSSPITSGNLITKTETDSDGNLNINYYDNNDNLVEQYVWDDEEVIYHIVMSYSDRDKLISKEEISPDGQSNVVYTFNYDSDDTLLLTTISEFEEGCLVKSTSYDENDSITGYSLYFYNDSDALSKIEIYNEKESMTEYFLYEYDSYGNKTKYSAFTADGVLEKYTTFEYNDALLVTKEMNFNSDNELENYMIYEYYASGNIKTSAQYDSDGNELTKDYFEDITQ